MSNFIHPDLFTQLQASGFFPSLCTIMTRDWVFDASGQRVPNTTATALDNCTDLPCRKSALILLRPSQGESADQKGRMSNVPYQVNLSVYRPAIAVDMTAIVDGVEYQIDGVDFDGERQMTRLKVSLPQPFGQV